MKQEVKAIINKYREAFIFPALPRNYVVGQ